MDTTKRTNSYGVTFWIKLFRWDNALRFGYAVYGNAFRKPAPIRSFNTYAEASNYMQACIHEDPLR